MVYRDDECAEDKQQIMIGTVTLCARRSASSSVFSNVFAAAASGPAAHSKISEPM